MRPSLICEASIKATNLVGQYLIFQDRSRVPIVVAVTRDNWAKIAAAEPDIHANSTVRARHGRMLLVRFTSPPADGAHGAFTGRSSPVPDH
jgi:hypothetical protein